MRPCSGLQQTSEVFRGSGVPPTRLSPPRRLVVADLLEPASDEVIKNDKPALIVDQPFALVNQQASKFYAL
jgi:hypothetical protein